MLSKMKEFGIEIKSCISRVVPLPKNRPLEVVSRELLNLHILNFSSFLVIGAPEAGAEGAVWPPRGEGRGPETCPTWLRIN